MVCKITKSPAHFSNEREKVSVNDSKGEKLQKIATPHFGL
jgi:hypothetical protein